MKLRTRLIVLFLAATLVPLGVTVWVTTYLLDRSLSYVTTQEIDDLSRTLEHIGRQYYQQAREQLRAEAESGRIAPRIHSLDDGSAPGEVREFADSNAAERFLLAGTSGRRLSYLKRVPDAVHVYTLELGLGMNDISRQIGDARKTVDLAAGRDLRRGFFYTFIVLAAGTWTVALIAVVFLARRMTNPIHALTQGLQSLSAGKLSTRLSGESGDEIGRAIFAFNSMAAQLEQSRERLVYLTRLASWQALARKMAHEVKNSLTPIRLTMEEMLARRNGADRAFVEQAAQIVSEEVDTLERRVRAFSDFAAEPPVQPNCIDVNALVEERVAFLRSAHPDVIYTVRRCTPPALAFADSDLVKGMLTNLVENASEAVGPGGVVLCAVRLEDGKPAIEVHDSGPGLSPLARSTLFEPTISFKKGGMGLGLSIARRSAVLCGGDIVAVASEMGGAAFRVLLPPYAELPVCKSAS